jgi:hypothetical protein
LTLGWGEWFILMSFGVPWEHVLLSAEWHLSKLLIWSESRSRTVALSSLNWSAWVHSVGGGVPVLLTLKLSPDSSLSDGWVLAVSVLESLDIGALLGAEGLSWWLLDERLLDWGGTTSLERRWLVWVGSGTGWEQWGRSCLWLAISGHDSLGCGGGFVAVRHWLLDGWWQSLGHAEAWGNLWLVSLLSHGRLGLLCGCLIVVHSWWCVGKFLNVILFIINHNELCSFWTILRQIWNLNRKA